eukprot:jgi/Ulvmu1/4363/UM002_0088.1
MQIQRPEHLLVTSEQGHPGANGPRPLHKAHQMTSVNHMPQLNPMGSSELLSSLPEGNSGMAHLPMPPPGSLPVGPSVDSSGLIRQPEVSSRSRSLPRNGGSNGSERFCLERVAQQHVLDLAVDNLSPPGSPTSREEQKRARVKSVDARGPAGLGPVTELHRGGSQASPPQVNSRSTHTSSPTDEIAGTIPPGVPVAVSDINTQAAVEAPSVQLPPRPGALPPARPTTHLPTRPSAPPVAPLSIPSPRQIPSAAHAGGNIGTGDTRTSPYRSGAVTPRSDAPSVQSSSAISSTKSRLRAPSASMLPNPGAEPSPTGSMLTPRGREPPLAPGSRIPRSPADTSSGVHTPIAARTSPGWQQASASKRSPGSAQRSRLPQPLSKSPASMLPSRSGTSINTSKASPSPQFVAPKPRATIFRGPSPGKADQTLQTTTAELDKLAATLKQVQHDISMSLPSSTQDAARPDQVQTSTDLSERGSHRNVWKHGEGGTRTRQVSIPAGNAGQGSSAQALQPSVNGDVSQPREPLVQVSNGAKPKNTPMQDAGHVLSDQVEAQMAAAVPGKASAPDQAGAADDDDVDTAHENSADDSTAERPKREKPRRKTANGTDKPRRKKVRCLIHSPCHVLYSADRAECDLTFMQKRERSTGVDTAGQAVAKPAASSMRTKSASSSNKKKKKPKPKNVEEPSAPVKSSSWWCCFA